MLHYLRNIRQKLILQENTKKYLLYAVGEIALVMIGILLALQVNNWNEDRVLQNQERQTLRSLQSELQVNVEILDGCLQEVNMVMVYGDSLRKYLGPDISTISIDSTNKWLGEIGSTRRCKVVTNVLEELKSSGNLSSISNIDIRRKIGDWSTSYNEMVKEEDEWAGELSNQFYPYTNKWVQWDDVDAMFSQNDFSTFKSRFKYDPRAILQQFEFSNVLSLHYWRMNRNKIRVNDLTENSTQLLELLNQSL